MKRFFAVPMLALSLAGLPALVGCDRTVSEEKVEKRAPDGSGVQVEKKTTQNPDGTVTKTQEKTTTDDEGDKKVETKTETKTPDND
jgi:hypothetical protein